MLLLSRCTYSSCPFAIQISHITCQKGGDEFVPLALFFGWVCVCSRMCHRQHLLSLSYFSTLCVFVCAFSLLLFFPSLPHFHSQSLALAKSIVRVALFLSSRRLLLYTCLFALAVLRWERPNLFLLCVTSV